MTMGTTGRHDIHSVEEAQLYRMKPNLMWDGEPGDIAFLV